MKRIMRAKWLILIGIGAMLLVVLAYVGADWWTREPPNYSRIEDGLYQGGLVDRPPPGTHAVLNLCRQQDSYEAPVHAWKPIRDAAPAPSIDWLREQVAFVEEHHRAGRTVYVHCRQGVSRSGMVITAYLMHKHRWPRDKALAFVRTQRGETRPNPAFMELLKEWETVVLGL